MDYRIYRKYGDFNVCIGNYTKGLEIMFIMQHGKIVDFGEGSYSLFN